MTNQRIEQLARSLRLRYGSSCAFELCEHLGISVLWQELPQQVNGFCLCFAGQQVIVLNQLAPQPLRNYVCAHELGHLLLHGRTNAVELTELTNFCLPRLENQADYFAACLLLQDSLPEWQQCYSPLTQAQVVQLSGLPVHVVRLCFEGRAVS